MLGLILVDHGSRRAASNQQLDGMVARVQALRSGDVVEPAHMELAEPGIPAAIATAVGRGATEIVVLLYFLSDGRHSQEDIPRLVAEAMAVHPGIPWRIGRPLGPHDALALLALEQAGLAPVP
jgi:sirohydrochlorin ferrochelatase